MNSIYPLRKILQLFLMRQTSFFILFLLVWPIWGQEMPLKMCIHLDQATGHFFVFKFAGSHHLATTMYLHSGAKMASNWPWQPKCTRNTHVLTLTTIFYRIRFPALKKNCPWTSLALGIKIHLSFSALNLIKQLSRFL